MVRILEIYRTYKTMFILYRVRFEKKVKHEDDQIIQRSIT